jgi:hypothetical protein
MRPTSITILTAILLGGCAVHVPATINEAGAYDQWGELDKGAVLVRDTTVDPRSFGLVAISATSNFYPGRFEFLTRSALADLGVTKVVNGRELFAYAKNHPKLKDIESLQDSGALKRISAYTGPIMIVEFSAVVSGQWFTRMRVTNGQGKVLLLVEHQKLVWGNGNKEAIYPVLNAFRSWFQESSGAKKI